MMKMAAMSPARCPGAASAIRVRLTPSSASPKTHAGHRGAGQEGGCGGRGDGGEGHRKANEQDQAG